MDRGGWLTAADRGIGLGDALCNGGKRLADGAGVAILKFGS
ncbi:MAG: hypothetical protein O2923_09870 [Verrucomicrobia bacterium]|nr:hypothetical protein [Verrucomicrobiota bacterium]